LTATDQPSTLLATLGGAYYTSESIFAAEQSQIFEQFQRGRAADSSGATGLGLGLSFVTAIVRGHRGKLDFESRPGETAFRIRLRRRRDRVQVAGPALAEHLAP